jgi:hypothetical protein
MDISALQGHELKSVETEGISPRLGCFIRMRLRNFLSIVPLLSFELLDRFGQTLSYRYGEKKYQ